VNTEQEILDAINQLYGLESEDEQLDKLADEIAKLREDEESS